MSVRIGTMPAGPLDAITDVAAASRCSPGVAPPHALTEQRLLAAMAQLSR